MAEPIRRIIRCPDCHNELPYMLKQGTQLVRCEARGCGYLFVADLTIVTEYQIKLGTIDMD